MTRSEARVAKKKISFIFSFYHLTNFLSVHVFAVDNKTYVFSVPLNHFHVLLSFRIFLNVVKMQSWISRRVLQWQYLIHCYVRALSVLQMSRQICEQIEKFDAHHKCCTSYTLLNALKIKSFSTNITNNSNTYR